MRSRKASAERHPVEADAAEVLVRAVAARALQDFLARVREALKAHPSLIAAGEQPFDLQLAGDMNGWWADAVDQHLIPTLAGIWKHGYFEQNTLSTGLDAVPSYLAQVRDRLVPGVGPNLSPSIPADAFNMVRGELVRGLATGASKDEIAASLAATFGWDQDATFWRAMKQDIDSKMTPLLDAYGKPGDPARELAKRSDPALAGFIQQRNLAQSKIDAVQSTWQNRADRIARTESTGALGAGALAALGKEGVDCKEWLATEDHRTRKEHRDADGQKRAHGMPFDLGGFPAMFPGDPTLPPHLSVNCRCTIVGCEEDTLPADQQAPEAEMPQEDNGQPMPWAESPEEAATHAALDAGEMPDWAQQLMAHVTTPVHELSAQEKYDQAWLNWHAANQKMESLKTGTKVKQENLEAYKVAKKAETEAYTNLLNAGHGAFQPSEELKAKAEAGLLEPVAAAIDTVQAKYDEAWLQWKVAEKKWAELDGTLGPNATATKYAAKAEEQTYAKLMDLTQQPAGSKQIKPSKEIEAKFKALQKPVPTELPVVGAQPLTGEELLAGVDWGTTLETAIPKPTGAAADKLVANLTGAAPAAPTAEAHQAFVSASEHLANLKAEQVKLDLAEKKNWMEITDVKQQLDVAIANGDSEVELDAKLKALKLKNAELNEQIGAIDDSVYQLQAETEDAAQAVLPAPIAPAAAAPDLATLEQALADANDNLTQAQEFHQEEQDAGSAALLKEAEQEHASAQAAYDAAVPAKAAASGVKTQAMLQAEVDALNAEAESYWHGVVKPAIKAHLDNPQSVAADDAMMAAKAHLADLQKQSDLAFNAISEAPLTAPAAPVAKEFAPVPEHLAHLTGTPKPIAPIAPNVADFGGDGRTVVQVEWDKLISDIESAWDPSKSPTGVTWQGSQLKPILENLRNNPGSTDGLDTLYQKYRNGAMSPAQVTRANNLAAKASTPLGQAPFLTPAKAKKYKAALDEYASAAASHKAALSDWRAANGLGTGRVLQGLDGGGVLDFPEESRGVSWGKANLTTPSRTSAAGQTLNDYTGSLNQPLNRSFYSQHGDGPTAIPAQFASEVQKIDSALQPMPNDILVRRGTDKGELILANGLAGDTAHAGDFAQQLIGTTQRQKGYLSTSIGGVEPAFGHKPVHIVFRVPQGHRGVFVEPITKVHGEREIILARDTEYFIHDVYWDGTYWRVEAEILPEGVSAADVREAYLAGSEEIQPLPAGRIGAHVKPPRGNPAPDVIIGAAPPPEESTMTDQNSNSALNTPLRNTLAGALPRYSPPDWNGGANVMAVGVPGDPTVTLGWLVYGGMAANTLAWLPVAPSPSDDWRKLMAARLAQAAADGVFSLAFTQSLQDDPNWPTGKPSWFVQLRGLLAMAAPGA